MREELPAETASTTSWIGGGLRGPASCVIGAGVCMGFGAIGPGIGEGFAAGKACEAIGRSPQDAGLLTRTMLIGQAVSESATTAKASRSGRHHYCCLESRSHLAQESVA